MRLPGGGFALDEGPQIGPPKLKINVGVQALPVLKHHPVGVLSVQHQLRCHQIHLQGPKSLAVLYNMHQNFEGSARVWVQSNEDDIPGQHRCDGVHECCAMHAVQCMLCDACWDNECCAMHAVQCMLGQCHHRGHIVTTSRHADLALIA